MIFPREFSGEKWWDLGKLTSNMKAGQSSREIINKGRRDFDKGPAYRDFLATLLFLPITFIYASSCLADTATVYQIHCM
jgi:hypothetical protein